MRTTCWKTAPCLQLLLAIFIASQGVGCSHASSVRESPVRTESIPPANAAKPMPEKEPFLVRMRYVETDSAQRLVAAESLILTTPDEGLKRLPGGAWKISHRSAQAATLVYSVYVRGFAHNETQALAEERQQWRNQGYATFVTTMGRSLSGADGTIHDGRKYWLGIKRCATEVEAVALKKKLQGQKVWAWTRSEIRSPAQGVLSFQDEHGNTVLTSSTPLRIRSAGSIALAGARPGKAPLIVSAPLDVELSRNGDLVIFGELPLETYLQGILPAEMYPDWPLEALKAQAVAARSEIIVHAAGKHYFDGFDFCIEQHCRAFAGAEGHHERTDRAVRETTDMVLINGDSVIVPTVFSANCGGWTENNENVWDGAPEAALRGRRDQIAANARRANRAVADWITKAPSSNCAHDGKYYRWSRSLSRDSLSKRFDKQYGIGRLQRVEALERGVSGRLKAVRLVGTRKSVIVRKELKIRQAFENLPSALCTFAVDRKSGVVHVRGAGRGHGVGLCQQGAYGMALAGESSGAILQHYFTNVKISRI